MARQRLIGPTVISLGACVLWIDYVFFRESQWSVSGFLLKIGAVLTTAFGPFFDPVTYGWVGNIVIPAGMILCAAFLLYVSVAKAKVDMSQATPRLGESVPLSRSKVKENTELMNVPAQVKIRLQPLPTRADDVVAPRSPKPLDEPKTSQRSEPIGSKLASNRRTLGLAEKLTGSLGVLTLIFCAAVSMISYARLTGAVESEMKLRAGLTVKGLAELADSFGAGRAQELSDAVSRRISDGGIAYIYIENADGKIIAHMPPELPTFLRRDFPKTGERAIDGVDVEYRGSPVYEVAARVGAPKPGYVHVAVWRGLAEAEARQIVTSIVKFSMVLLLVAIAIFGWVVWRMTRPLVELAQYANRVSSGDYALDFKSTDESGDVGDLVRAFARMRSSLHAVLTRIEKGDPPERL